MCSNMLYHISGMCTGRVFGKCTRVNKISFIIVKIFDFTLWALVQFVPPIFTFLGQKFFVTKTHINGIPSSPGDPQCKNFSIWTPLGLATGLQKFSKKFFFCKKYALWRFGSIAVYLSNQLLSEQRTFIWAINFYLSNQIFIWAINFYLSNGIF